MYIIYVHTHVQLLSKQYSKQYKLKNIQGPHFGRSFPHSKASEQSVRKIGLHFPIEEWRPLQLARPQLQALFFICPLFTKTLFQSLFPTFRSLTSCLNTRNGDLRPSKNQAYRLIFSYSLSFQHFRDVRYVVVNQMKAHCAENVQTFCEKDYKKPMGKVDIFDKFPA